MNCSLCAYAKANRKDDIPDACTSPTFVLRDGIFDELSILRGCSHSWKIAKHVTSPVTLYTRDVY